VVAAKITLAVKDEILNTGKDFKNLSKVAKYPTWFPSKSGH
jgi:hypothetical protein